MRSLLWYSSVVVAALAACAAAAGETPAAQTSAVWERKASEWALKTYSEAVAKQPEVVAAVRAAQAKSASALPAPALADADQARGFVLFAWPSWKFVGRKAPPSTEEAKLTKLALSAARGEWKAIQLAVWTLKDLPQVACQVTDLACGAEKIAAAEHVRIYHVLNLLAPAPKTAGAPDGDIVAGEKTAAAAYEEYPAALLDLPALDLPAQEAHALWLDIRVPPTATAGDYSAEVRIQVAGQVAAKLPLSLRVHPFVLDPADGWGRGPFTNKMRNRDELVHMHENGINMMSWWTIGGCKVELKKGKIETDFKPYQDYLKLMDGIGYRGPHMVFLGGSDPKLQNTISKMLDRSLITDARNEKSAPLFKKSDLSPPFGDYLCQALKQFHEQMAAVGHGNLPACLLDEPDHKPRPERIDWYNKMFALVEKGAPEVPLYGTFYHPGDEDKLSHHHAVWTTNCPSREKATACRKAGKQLWTYGFGHRYVDNAELVRFRLGLVPWVYGATGSFFWANFWNEGEPFDPFTVKNADTFSLPTPHGPLASLMLKAIREAIDDRRYLVTLEKLIDQAARSNNAAAKAAAQQHAAFLDSIRAPLFEKMGVRGGRANFENCGRIEIAGGNGRKGVIEGAESSGRPFAEFLREEVTERIVALQALLK